MSAQGVDVPNLIKIDSAVAALRICEKTRVRVALFTDSIGPVSKQRILIRDSVLLDVS